MSIRMIASVVIAALLMTGGAAAVTNGTEVKIPPVKEQNIALTQEEAKNIAMNHAGLAEEEIRDLQVERDMERGVQKWDIDFRSGDWEYDYEINAETGVLITVNKEYDPEKTVGFVESVPSKPTETKPAETQPPKTEKLSAEEAKDIALKHAGLEADQVKGLRAEFDEDDGRYVWDIDFRSGDWEYDYEINAETGVVIKGEKEYDPEKTAGSAESVPSKPVETKPAETQPPKTEKLSAEEAKAIALKHAGLEADQVKGLRAEFDEDDGRYVWDIDFRSGNWEYDYEINAETGVVIKGEKEYDPERTAGSAESAPSKPTGTKPAETQPPKTEKLSAEEAKAIALKHAGLKASQVKGLRAEYDVDDGVPEWEVEFYEGGMEYSYEIHAESGKIRSWDKEKED